MDTVLPVLGFVVIAVLWSGYLFLEGFDLGVGCTCSSPRGRRRTAG